MENLTLFDRQQSLAVAFSEERKRCFPRTLTKLDLIPKNAATTLMARMRFIADITVQFTRIPKRSFRFFAANDRDGLGNGLAGFGPLRRKAAINVADAQH
ncbi:hypothetical protein [Brucella anthropi]|uniref:hypothetical protein n=1 Tax=Brucella anthropi TaxID=529 RepID=UPI00384D2E66